MEDEPVVAHALLVHELRHARAGWEPVVVEDDDAAGREPRPDPVEDVPGRLVDVDVAVAEAERRLRDLVARLFRKDPLQQLDVRQAESA